MSGWSLTSNQGLSTTEVKPSLCHRFFFFFPTIFTKLKCYLMCLKISKIFSWESPRVRLSPISSSVLTKITFPIMGPGRLSCRMFLGQVFHCMGHDTTECIIPAFCPNVQVISKLEF